MQWVVVASVGFGIVGGLFIVRLRLVIAASLATAIAGVFWSPWGGVVGGRDRSTAFNSNGVSSGSLRVLWIFKCEGGRQDVGSLAKFPL